MSLAAEHGQDSMVAEQAFSRLPLHVRQIGEALATLSLPDGWRANYDHFPGLVVISPDGHYHRMMRPTEGGWFVSHPYESVETAPTAQAGAELLVSRWPGPRA